MTALPAYVNSVFLLLIASFIAVTHYPIQRANQYLADVSAMIACHEALVQYADRSAAPGFSNAVPAMTLDAFLLPGVSPCEIYPFSFVFAAPGTAVTYLNAPSLSQNTIIQVVQKFSISAAYGLTAGATVANGSGGTQIVPELPATPVATPATIPTNTIAIQSIIKSH
jgi:hypothetical protein